MADAAPGNTIHVPVYGTLTVYPNGSRDEAAGQRFETPCVVPIRPGDCIGFTFGAGADVDDDDLREFADAIAHVPCLRSLNIGGCVRVSDRGLGCFAKFDRLEDL